MNIAIIDYKAGNIKSVEAALQSLGCKTILTGNSRIIQEADKVIFPGVGHAGTAMQALIAAGLDNTIKKLTQPVLGICLGMQLLCNSSTEGDTIGLGIFNQTVTRFIPQNSEKIPHMGWNQLYNNNSPLLYKVPDNSFVYFVHSYQVPVFEFTAATCLYTGPFSAAIAKNNFYGTQFHPEKSGNTGLQILKNFINL